MAEDLVEHVVADGDAVGPARIIGSLGRLVKVLIGDLLLQPAPKGLIHLSFRDKEVTLYLGDEP